MLKQREGFTLIELLVVVSIIGLLSSIVLAGLNTARIKARGTKQRSDMIQVRTALEHYFLSNNSYPSTGGSWRAACPSYGGYANSGSNAWIPDLAPTYIPLLPTDPNANNAGGCYLYRSDGTNYKFLIHGTVQDISCPPIPSTTPFYDPNRSTTQCTLAIYSPGGSGW
ncbi:type II secretion system protein [Patescibacteria group bacterium]|nr:type II secretion system protein [Patescibacteria group bacterium]